MSKVPLYARTTGVARSSGHTIEDPHPKLKFGPYRGASLIINSAPLGPYSRTMPRALWWSYGGGLFPMSEVPL